MHIGQVREAIMSRIARTEGKPAIVPPFEAPTRDELRRRLVQAGLPETGMEILTRGKDGPALERPSTAGWIYWNRLAYLAQRKIQASIDGSDGQSLDELDAIQRQHRRQVGRRAGRQWYR
jgi:DNA-directed RNA polymerase beta subunit